MVEIISVTIIHIKRIFHMIFHNSTFEIPKINSIVNFFDIFQT